MKKFLLFLCAMLLVFGMVGSASAIPLLNEDGDGNPIQFDGSGASYGTYLNSGLFMFTQSGNNEGNNLEDVEILVKKWIGYELDLIVASMTYGIDDVGNTGTWAANPEDAVISFYAVKAGSGYAMYQVDPAEGTGSWSTYDLWETGLYNSGDALELSHFTGYIPGVSVPEPSTMLLLGFGLVGLAAVGRKKFRTS